jgi:hypothetical protein
MGTSGTAVSARLVPQAIRNSENSTYNSRLCSSERVIGISQFTTWIIQSDSDLIQAAKKVNAG